jgi:hypothetical protein
VKGLGRVEVRCRDHESLDSQCEICRFMRHIEQDLGILRCRRDYIFKELKQRLAKKELIMIDLR